MFKVIKAMLLLFLLFCQFQDFGQEVTVKSLLNEMIDFDAVAK